jgi:RNA polymerase sigma-70 factor (ECF subfamily)
VLSDAKKLLSHLPDEQKEIVMMRLYYDMSFKEISDTLNISINTALGRMRYALINLRKLIEKNQMEMTLK